MTRDDYINLKTNLKENVKRLRSLKYLVREDESSASRGLPGSGSPLSQTRRDLRDLYRDVRTNHVFMSLIRGRTRVQIENNFETQAPENGLYSWLDKDIKTLCEKYELEYEVNEHYKVISIIGHNSKRDAA